MFTILVHSVLSAYVVIREEPQPHKSGVLSSSQPIFGQFKWFLYFSKAVKEKKSTKRLIYLKPKLLSGSLQTKFANSCHKGWQEAIKLQKNIQKPE